MSELDYKDGKFPFGPAMMCPSCKTKLQSRYRGEFCGCMCGNFVDQTGHYSRYGGRLVPWDEVSRGDEEVFDLLKALDEELED